MYECIATRLGPVGGLFETVGCGEPSGYQLLCGTSTCSMMLVLHTLPDGIKVRGLERQKKQKIKIKHVTQYSDAESSQATYRLECRLLLS